MAEYRKSATCVFATSFVPFRRLPIGLRIMVMGFALTTFAYLLRSPVVPWRVLPRPPVMDDGTEEHMTDENMCCKFEGQCSSGIGI